MANNEILTSTVGVNTVDNPNQILVGRLLKLKDNLFNGNTEITLAFCNDLADDEALADMVMEGNLRTEKVSVDKGTPGLEALWLKHSYGCLVRVKGTASQTTRGNYWMNVEAVKIIDEDASEEDKAIRCSVLPNKVASTRRTVRVMKR